jgi:hypothetical protein
LGAIKSIESPTSIEAINHERIQIKIKFSLKPKLNETKTNVTKNVVIVLIKVANLMSFFVGIFIIYLLLLTFKLSTKVSLL